MKSNSSLPIIGITSGDPAGIGPELSLRLLIEKRILNECIPLVFGDGTLFKKVAQQCKLPGPKNILHLDDYKKNHSINIPTIIDCPGIDPDSIQPGKVNAQCGKAAFTYIKESIRAALAGKIAAVTTGPINKESLNLAEIRYPGHTEIFTELTQAKRACMMLTSEKLTVSFVTTHISYTDVPKQLSVERIQEVIELTDEAMNVIRGRKVRLVVCGLNPHSGEHGLFGSREEQNFIEPAISASQKKGIQVKGPIPPDTVFVPRFLKDIDAVVCMYHDQGHIPFKMTAFDTGVNVTLGLPIVRTSVDHGTAFDIAWKGLANPNSFIEAVLLAVRLSRGTISNISDHMIKKDKAQQT